MAQTMFAMMKTGKMERFMKDLEIFGLLVACVSCKSFGKIFEERINGDDERKKKSLKISE